MQSALNGQMDSQMDADDIVSDQAETRSLPDLSSRRSIPLPSPKVPNEVSSPPHGLSNSSPSTPRNSSSAVPLTSALPSPLQLLCAKGLQSSEERAVSLPPTNGSDPSVAAAAAATQTTPNRSLGRSNSFHGSADNSSKVELRRSRSADTDTDTPVDGGTAAARGTLSKVSIPHSPEENGNAMNAMNSMNGNGLHVVTSSSKSSPSYEYPFDFVDSIIKILSQCSKLSVFTIRVLSELLIDLVQDRTMRQNGLHDRHHAALSLVWVAVKSQVAGYLPLESAAMETYFIDTFEEEWRSVRQQPRINTLVANPIRILPPHVFHGKEPSKNPPQKPGPPDKETGDDVNPLPPQSPSGILVYEFTVNFSMNLMIGLFFCDCVLMHYLKQIRSR